jgi:hypothetical protein
MDTRDESTDNIGQYRNDPKDDETSESHKTFDKKLPYEIIL